MKEIHEIISHELNKMSFVKPRDGTKAEKKMIRAGIIH